MKAFKYVWGTGENACKQLGTSLKLCCLVKGYYMSYALTKGSFAHLPGT